MKETKFNEAFGKFEVWYSFFYRILFLEMLINGITFLKFKIKVK